MERTGKDGSGRCRCVFIAIHDVYEEVTNGMEPLYANAIDVQKNVHKWFVKTGRENNNNNNKR